MGKVFGVMGTVAGWCFSLFCFAAVLVYGINIGSLLLLLCGIAALPLKAIQTILEKVPTKLRRWKVPLLGVLFFTAVLMLPTEKREEANSGGNYEPVTITQAATNTPIPIATSTPMPTATNTPMPTATNTPMPTATSTPIPTPTQTVVMLTEVPNLTLAEVPSYSGAPYVVINNNEPLFADASLTTESYEFYSELDELGRCGVTAACIGIDIMPTEERGSIGQVKPTGWHTVKYDVVDGMYLYNRCHLIGFQLTGENANTRNLITGTRYMNVDGMLPFENMVADYVEETGNHVMYRVTPLFDGDNLVADGVLMEAKSVEDNGEGILFNVFVYNVQPGVEIDYATGESALNVSVPEDLLYVSVSDKEVTLTDEMQVVYVTGNVVEGDLFFDASIDNVFIVDCEWGEWGTGDQWNTVPLYLYPVGSGTTTIRIRLSETEVYATIIVTVDISSDNAEDQEDITSAVYVWISETGSKYHNKNNCGNMNPDKAYQLELDEAIKRGYDACKKCY